MNSPSSHRLQSLQLDDMEYAKSRIVMYNELPTKAQLLQFIFEVEERLEALEFGPQSHECEACGHPYYDEDEE